MGRVVSHSSRTRVRHHSSRFSLNPPVLGGILVCTAPPLTLSTLLLCVKDRRSIPRVVRNPHRGKPSCNAQEWSPSTLDGRRGGKTIRHWIMVRVAESRRRGTWAVVLPGDRRRSSRTRKARRRGFLLLSYVGRRRAGLWRGCARAGGIILDGRAI